MPNNFLQNISHYLDTGIRPTDDQIILKEIPPVLQFIGIHQNELVLKIKVLNKARRIHGLSNREIKNAIHDIADPILIFNSDKSTTENKKKSILLLTNTFVKEKKPVAISINIDSDSIRRRSALTIHEITSLHDRNLIAKNGTNILLAWTTKGLCRYVDDKRISDWQLAAGVQFPFAVLQSDKHIILTKTDFVNNTQIINKVDTAKSKKRELVARHYYDNGAKTLYEGIKDGTLPAVSIAGAEIKDGMITMASNAVRYYTNGKMFTGVNQLVAQKFAKDLNFEPDKDGNIYVVTYHQAGEKNLMKRQKHFPLASYDKEKNQVNYYNLYSETALIDKTTVIRASSPYNELQEHGRHRQITIRATDKNISIAEYFGKYEAASKLGAKFVTTEAAIKSVQEKAEKEIAPHIKTGLTGKVYALSAEMSNVSKDEMQKVFQSMKPKAREMTMQRDQSISMN